MARTGTDARAMRRYRRVAHYLAAAMIFLRDNALLDQELRPLDPTAARVFAGND